MFVSPARSPSVSRAAYMLSSPVCVTIMTIGNGIRAVYLHLKRHYILSSTAVVFLVMLVSYLNNKTSHLTKITESVQTTGICQSREAMVLRSESTCSADLVQRLVWLTSTTREPQSLLQLVHRKSEAESSAGQTIHAPSSDFFVKPVPESFILPVKEQRKLDSPNPTGRRMADVAKAPEFLARPANPRPVGVSTNPNEKIDHGQQEEVEKANREEELQLIDGVLAKKYGDKEQKDDQVKKEPTFAAKMIMQSREREYKRRYTFKDVPDTVYKSVHDITHLCPEGDPPIKFSKWFNSYCWFENNCGCKEEPSMLRCLPKFHLIGFPKAGTTDLFRRLMKHPQILNSKKETNYWSVTRFIELGNETELLRGNDTMALFTEDHIVNLENASVITKGIESYLDFYNRPMLEVERDFEHSGIKRVPSTLVLGEGSVTYAYSSLGLRISIGNILNKSPMEVDCTIPKIIKYITPDAKIIVIMRNPAERLYSDYRNLFLALRAENKTAADFHKRVVNRIAMWNKCVSQKSEEYCVNSPQFEAVAVHSNIIGLVRSMYVVHIQKWLKEFPRNQIYMVHFEERMANATRIIKDILQFLDLDPLPSDKLNKISHEHIPMYEGGNARPHQAGYGKEPMWESTRAILEDFYRPFNKRLALLLDDEKYLWYDSQKQFKVPKMNVTNNE